MVLVVAHETAIIKHNCSIGDLKEALLCPINLLNLQHQPEQAIQCGQCYFFGEISAIPASDSPKF